MPTPAGICISGTAFDQVDGKLPIAFKFIGEQQVKNIAKPIRVYRVVTGVSEGKSRPFGRGRSPGLIIGVAAIVAVLVAAGIAWKMQKPAMDHAAQSDPRIPRLAVLPLDNISPNSEDEYFSDGMTEELISRLSRVKGLDVIARTSVMQYKGKTKNVKDIGRELNVDTVLEGSVRRAGNKVRITVQLIDVDSQGHLWSEDYDREIKDVLATQSEISRTVTNALHVRLAATAAMGEPKRLLGDAETYNLYLKGRFHWSKLTLDGLKKSIEYFEQAIARSPNDARSWAGIADAYVWLGWFSFLPPNETFPKAKAAAERALALDENLAEAHASLGLVRFLFEWDWTGAKQAYERAIELSPSYALAHLWYGIYFKAMGAQDSALEQIMRANELDPLFLIANAEIGWAAYYRRDFPEAERACRKTLELDPNFLFALSCLQFALGLQKNPEVVRIASRLVELNPGDPYMLGGLGWAHGVLGQTAQARDILATLNPISLKVALPPTSTFPVYVGLGDRDQALKELERARRERWGDMVWIKTDPMFDPLRQDPRFITLLKKMDFPESP